MTKQEALTKLKNDIYKAALIFEELEHQYLIVGNGHHIAQEIASFAENILEQRWIDKEEK